MEQRQSARTVASFGEQNGEVQARVGIVRLPREYAPEGSLGRVEIVLHIGDDSVEQHHVGIPGEVLERLRGQITRRVDLPRRDVSPEEPVDDRARGLIPLKFSREICERRPERVVYPDIAGSIVFGGRAEGALSAGYHKEAVHRGALDRFTDRQYVTLIHPMDIARSCEVVGDAQ